MLSRGLAIVTLVAAGGAPTAHAGPDAASPREVASADLPEPADAELDGAPADPPRPEKKKKKKKARGDAGWTVAGFQVAVDTVEATSATGFLHGHGTLDADAAFLEAGAEARFEAERGRWRLRAPVEAAHRSTAGASLDESDGAVGLELRYRKSRLLRLTAAAEIAGVWRPDWPDQYQPQPGGGYAPTDRYSHWDRELELGVASSPWKRNHGRLKYDYTIVDYRSDPNFDPLDEPTHLVPSDHSRHRLRGSWSRNGDRTSLDASLELSVKSYFFAFARDAGTGLTHAGAGGAPPNPLQRLIGVEPAVGVEREIGDWQLEVDYSFEVVDDVFEGYYSYTGHHPGIELSRKLGDHRVGIEGELWWRRYGPGSYAESASHPPLTYGDRRVDRKGKIELAGEYRVATSWLATAATSLVSRRTNFPPYRPGVFPSSRQYSIDWNYDNWQLMVGIEHEL
jgi:hypothetical protein